jgi:demethylmenaquinone methyltransferase/2-methoxy-6-polyprenyl-1,4-benzoquinol methylase
MQGYYPSKPMRLADAIATPDGKRRYVRRLFSTIADRYDLITVVLSYGQDQRWKRRLVGLVGGDGRIAARRSGRALDLATGTGDIAFRLAAAGWDVVGLDVTLRMIELAREKSAARTSDLRIPGFLVGDMLALPFPNASFDVVTAGYGLRNVPDLPAAIDEIHRVLTDGGQMLSLDFNRPANPFVRRVYLAYLQLTGGLLGWILHRDADTYRYIPASIRNYPGAAGVARLLEARGFVRVQHRAVIGGLMTIHSAHKAGA